MWCDGLIWRINRIIWYMCSSTPPLTKEGYYYESSTGLTTIPAIDASIWILGVKYNALFDIMHVREDICTKIWMTYRKKFPPIGDTNKTTDRGWGCMLRCGQMVLAQALVNLHLGRSWVWSPETTHPTYLEIIHRLEDRHEAQYSLHRIAQMGVYEGKVIGQWFGPNTIAQVIKKIISQDEFIPLVVHVCLNNMLIINDVYETTGRGSSWRPLILFLPMRLGLRKLNPIYAKAVRNSFKCPQSLGILGGKPNMALWFFACLGFELYCLDPHTTQNAVCIGRKETQEQILADLTYHCRKAPKMHILTMDPSIAMCFYCKTEADFANLLDSFKKRLLTSDKQRIVNIIMNKPAPMEPDILETIILE